MTTETISYTKIPRAELVAAMRKRDGDMCQHPDCNGVLDFTVLEGPLEVTIDHWIPQYFGRENEWTMDQMGDLIPNEDGTLPKKPQSTFRFRRQKRAGRPELCVECDNGHNLNVGEVCANCGCNAQRFPKAAKIRPSECDHELFWCAWCSIGVIPRVASVDIAVRQGESGEWE
jgi:hypothetical protein